MARIADHELERLKREVSLERLIESAGLSLSKQGKDLACRCPFHEGDDTPSLIVTPSSNLWHCFGCDAGGSVVDWVMRFHQVSFRHAVELLQKQLPALAAIPALTEERKRLPATAVRKAAGSFDLSAGDQALLNQVIGFYHESLKQSPEALAYLEKRGLHDPELIERFKLGYANRTLAYRLLPKQVKAGAEMRAALQRIGLLRDSGHEHFNGSVVIPIFDQEGNVVEVYGRKIRDDLRAGTVYHLYLSGPHRGVFNREGIEGQAEVILCEALIDALTFWRAGYRNVTASFGVHGFTDEMLTAFKASGIQRVLIAYDRDEAGDRAAESLAQQLQSEGFDGFRLLFPKGMDANEYALKVQPAGKSLGVVIRAAQAMSQDAARPSPMTIPVGSNPAPATSNRTASEEAAEAPCISAPIVPLAAESRTPTGPEPQPSPSGTLPLPAHAVPVVAMPDIEADISEREVVVSFGARRYRVRGLARNTSVEVLKVNVLVSAGEALHVDTLDLYQAKARQQYARQAACELSVEEAVINRDLGRLLLKLEQLQDQLLRETLVPQVSLPAMTETEQQAALDLLRDPKLIERIAADFDRIGLVGEAANTLVGYLACVSRKLEQPLALILQSSSAAGKSALMDAVLSLVPEEDRVHYSAMTGQSLFYLGETDLKHKILAIAEEEGVRQAAYALKLLQSQGELTIASTGKDPETGKLLTEEYHVEGPVTLFLTTTAIDLDEELLNRCLVLSVNESREQTRAIQERQRQSRTLEGLLAKAEKDAILTLHRNAQRLLRPLAVVNPYAPQLTFLDDRTRTRRDHQKYLTLIEAIALLHQQQREIRRVTHQGQEIEYLEVQLADIALANQLAHEVLGRSLDELPPQTRRLLSLIETMVSERCQAQSIARKDYRFSRKDIRSISGLSDTQVRIHLERLVQLEYLLSHAGQNGSRYVYELVFDGKIEASTPQMMGLIDVEALKATGTTLTSRGKKATSRRPCGPLTATLRTACGTPKTAQPRVLKKLLIP